MIKVYFERSELCLKTGLQNMCAAAVHRRRYFAILNVSTNLVKHKTGVFREIPVQPCGEVGFFTSLDGPIVQVYKGEPGRQLPGSPSPFSGTKIVLRLWAEERT